MTLDEIIVQRLLNYQPLADLIQTRIYPLTYPQDSVMPVVVYQCSSTDFPDYHHGGDSKVRDSRYQISSFSKNYGEAQHIARLIFDAFEPWMTAQETISGELIGGCFAENVFPVRNEESLETLSNYQVLGDYVFLHGEA